MLASEECARLLETAVLRATGTTGLEFHGCVGQGRCFGGGRAWFIQRITECGHRDKLSNDHQAWSSVSRQARHALRGGSSRLARRTSGLRIERASAGRRLGRVTPRAHERVYSDMSKRTPCGGRAVEFYDFGLAFGYRADGWQLAIERKDPRVPSLTSVGDGCTTTQSSTGPQQAEALAFGSGPKRAGVMWKAQGWRQRGEVTSVPAAQLEASSRRFTEAQGSIGLGRDGNVAVEQRTR